MARIVHIHRGGDDREVWQSERLFGEVAISFHDELGREHLIAVFPRLDPPPSRRFKFRDDKATHDQHKDLGELFELLNWFQTEIPKQGLTKPTIRDFLRWGKRNLAELKEMKAKNGCRGPRKKF
jgi:hypothetical protein